MLYHARLNVEYTKINIFQNEETVLENFATTIDCYGSNDSISSTTWNTRPAVIAHQDQKKQIILMTTTRYCTSCVRADERFSDNRTKFDFVVACGLAELADDGMGRPASGSGSASGTDHV
jgi:glutaredoxin-related protein